jgi:hypothetical protein
MILFIKGEPLLSLNPLSGNAPYFSILLCLMPDDFTSQVASATTQWIKKELTAWGRLFKAGLA